MACRARGFERRTRAFGEGGSAAAEDLQLARFGRAETARSSRHGRDGRLHALSTF